MVGVTSLNINKDRQDMYPGLLWRRDEERKEGLCGQKRRKGPGEEEDVKHLGRVCGRGVGSSGERGAVMMDGEIQKDRVTGCCWRERDRSRSQ